MLRTLPALFLVCVVAGGVAWVTGWWTFRPEPVVVLRDAADAEDPRVRFHGVVRFDREIDLGRPLNGELYLVGVGHKASCKQAVRVVEGRFDADVRPAPYRVEGAAFYGLPALSRASIVHPSQGELTVELEWCAAVPVEVVSAAHDEVLESSALVRRSHWDERAPDLVIAAGSPTPFVAESLAVAVPRGVSSVRAVTRHLVGAPGFAWQPIEIDHFVSQKLVVELEPGFDLAVVLDGRLPAEGCVDLRLYALDVAEELPVSLDALRERLANVPFARYCVDSARVTLPGLPRGQYLLAAFEMESRGDLRVIVGDDPLAFSTIQLSAQRHPRVTLRLASPRGESRAFLVRWPVEWTVDPAVQVYQRRADVAGSAELTQHACSVRILERRPGEMLVDVLGVEAGSIALLAPNVGGASVLEVPWSSPASEPTEVCWEAPPVVWDVRLRGEDGSARRITSARWAPVGGVWKSWAWRDPVQSEPDEDGAVRLIVPQGLVDLELRGPFGRLRRTIEATGRERIVLTVPEAAGD